MLVKRSLIVTCLLSLSFAADAVEENLRGVDVRTFDVAGVNTGMDMNQAIEAITKHFKIAKSSLRIDPPKGYPVAEFKNSSIIYKNGGESLSVTLVPRVPVDNSKPQVVTRVSYKLSDTPENKKSMVDGAVAKYGEPNRNVGLTKEWCLMPSSPRGLGVMCSLDKNKAVLMLNMVYLELSLDDRSWTNSISEYIKQPIKPKSGF